MAGGVEAWGGKHAPAQNLSVPTEALYPHTSVSIVSEL